MKFKYIVVDYDAGVNATNKEEDIKDFKQSYEHVVINAEDGTQWDPDKEEWEAIKALTEESDSARYEHNPEDELQKDQG